MLEARLPLGGLRVSPLCLGGNRLGTALSEDESFRLLDAFAECGGNFLDTARIYSDWVPGASRGASEAVIGRWLRARHPLDVVVATKAGHPALDRPDRGRLTRTDLGSDIDASREALGLDRLPLLFLHRDDPAVPVGEIVDLLEEFRAAGAIAAYAASNWTLDRLEAARRHAAARGRSGFAASQPEWSPIRRNPRTRAADLVAADAAMLEWHAATGLPMVPYSAQAQGYAEKALEGRLDPDARRNYDSPANRALAEDLRRDGEALGLGATQMLLRRMAAMPFPVIPVVGCRTPEQVRQSARAFAESLGVLTPSRSTAGGPPFGA